MNFHAILAIVLCVIAGNAVAAPRDLRPVVVAVPWIAQAQYTGLYMAKEKGFFASRGLDVSFLHDRINPSPAVLLSKAEAHFAIIFISNALRDRATLGIPLVNIAQLSQESEQVLVARKSSGIRGPQDLDGKRVSLWPEMRVRPLVLFRKFGVQPEVVPQSATVNLLLRGGVDAASAMMYNEYHLLLQAGLDEDDLVVIRFDEYGLGFPEDGLYCLQSTLDRDRGLCRAMAQATIDGWRYAFEHFEESLAVTLRYAQEAHTGTSRAHQRWMLERMRDIVKPPVAGNGMGELSHEAYANAVNVLKEAGVIDSAPSLKEFHDLCLETRP